MFNLSVIEEVKRKFKVDLVSDVFPKDVQQLSFCIDWSQKEDAVIRIVSGEMGVLQIFGDDVAVDFTVKDIINKIEINNPISEVYGRENYISGIIRDLTTLNEINEFYLPFKTKDGILWFCLSCKSLTKKNNENELIYGRINFITKETPRAIKYYENRFKDESTNLFTKETLKLHLSLTNETDHSYGLYFDIDNFKRINDVFGHKSGDIFLKELGNKLMSKFESDIIHYRIGGDEFFVYIINCTEEAAYKRALDIIYDIETLNPQGQQVEVSASIGIVPIIGNNFDFESLMDLADRTMYFSKRKGKGNISYAREV